MRIDQRSLKFLLEQRIINPNYQKWVTKPLGFNFEIQFKPGLKNKAADALSQMSHSTIQSLQLLSLPYPVELKQLHDQIQLNAYLKNIYTNLQVDPSSHPGFSIMQRRRFFKNKLIIPSTSPLVSSIMQHNHFGPLWYITNSQPYQRQFFLGRH